MTDLAVDSITMFEAGARCNDIAVQLYTALDGVRHELLASEGMAGTDVGGTAWAASYDSRAVSISNTAEALVRALENYAGALRTAGVNHAVAEADATAGHLGRPSPPPETAPTPGCDIPLPASAGGPGSGLEDGALGLVERIGVTVPNADTGKLQIAFTVWHGMSNSDALTNASPALADMISSFDTTSSPELDCIIDDLEDLIEVVESLRLACRELADSCEEYRQSVEEFRVGLRDIVTDLAVELGITAVVTVTASLVTMGVAAAVGTAESAKTLSRFARVVSEAIALWRNEKNIDRGVSATDDLRGVRLVLERLKSLGRDVADRPPAVPPRRHLVELFEQGRAPRATDLEDLARAEGWARLQTPGGPVKYVDENGVVRLTLKHGSDRAPGSASPHVELRDSSGQRVDPFGAPVSRRSPDNHTPIEWDLP